MADPFELDAFATAAPAPDPFFAFGDGADAAAAPTPADASLQPFDDAFDAGLGAGGAPLASGGGWDDGDASSLHAAAGAAAFAALPSDDATASAFPVATLDATSPLVTGAGAVVASSSSGLPDWAGSTLDASAGAAPAHGADGGAGAGDSLADVSALAPAPAPPADVFAIEGDEADAAAAPAASTTSSAPAAPAAATAPPASEQPSAPSAPAASPAPTPAARVTQAEATGADGAAGAVPDDDGTTLPPLDAPPAPAAPSLRAASLSTLDVAWTPVDGATGYYVDFESRGRERDDAALAAAVGADTAARALTTWRGDGGRAMAAGSSLLPPSAAASGVRLTGLAKHTRYAVRVTAVRTRRVVLPDGAALEQTAASLPSAEGAPLFSTLDSGSELARLSAANAALAAENARIAVLEAEAEARDAAHAEEVEALGAELHRVSDGLAAATAEAAGLAAELATRTTERDAALAAAAAAAADAAAARTRGDGLQAELTSSTVINASLTATLAERDSALAAAATAAAAAASEAEAAAARIAAADAANGDLRASLNDRDARIKSLQTELDAAAKRLSLLTGDKELLVTKLADDLAKVMEECDTVTMRLHEAQDYVAYLEPPAKLVIGLRERQAAWDKEHKAVEEAHGLQRILAARKLGPRPELVL